VWPEAEQKIVPFKKGGVLVRGWRTKFIFLLIVYFAGFATAVYTLAPAPDKKAQNSRKLNQKISVNSEFNSDDFLKSFNSGIHKCIDFGKEAACLTGKFIKEKIEERQHKTDS
jgi:hypothetical protein